MAAHSTMGEERWDVVRIVGPHRRTMVVASDPREERKAAHSIRAAKGWAEARSSVGVQAQRAPPKRRAPIEDAVRRMRPQWSRHMRGALGRPRAHPRAVPPQVEEWAEPTVDDEDLEREMVEGWVWEEDDKGDG